MFKKIGAVLLPLFLSLFASAQNRSVEFDGSISTGFLAGERSPGFQLQVVNGVKYKTWSAGLGAGLDYYHTRSVPLFLALRKRATTKPRTAFFYLDAGHNFPWLQDQDKTFTAGSEGGLYAEGGVGYEEPLFKTSRLFLGIGWRVKKFSEKVNSMPYIAIWPLPESAYRDYDYTLTCIAMKVGLRF